MNAVFKLACVFAIISLGKFLELMPLPMQLLIICCINQSINVAKAEAIAEPETEEEGEAEPEGYFIKCIQGSISQGTRVTWQETECPEGTSQCMNATNSAAGGKINYDFIFLQ